MNFGSGDCTTEETKPLGDPDCCNGNLGVHKPSVCTLPYTLPHIYLHTGHPRVMQYHSLVLVTYVLALLCPLLCAGYLFAADPDVVIYRHEVDVNETGNKTVFCDLDTQVCTNGDALCAQGDKLVLGSDCDPTGFWTALLLLKWVYIFVWLTRLPILFTSVMHAVGKEGKVTPPHKLVDVCSVVSQLASFAAFVIYVGVLYGRMQFFGSEQRVVYFPTGFPVMLWYVMRLDFAISLLLPLWFFLSDYSFVSCRLAFYELIVASLVSAVIAFTMILHNTEIMENYMPFVYLPLLTYPVYWYFSSWSYLGGLAELLTVCSFFVYTASYYALGVEDREDTTYFMCALHKFQMMAPMCLFSIALTITSVWEIRPQKQIYKPITWEGVCAMPEQQAAAVTLVLTAIHTKDSRTLEALPQDTLHTAFHGATVAEMSRIVQYFCETTNRFAIIVASRVLIDRNDLLVDMDIPASLKYRLLKACDDEALSTHVLDKIPIAELCKAINDVERNPDEALDYVEKFGFVEKLIPECKAVPSWRYMLPFVGSAHTPLCALLARGYKELLPKKRLYIAAAVMWVCVYLAGFLFSIYVCVTLGLEEDTDGSMPLFLAFLVPAGVLVSHDVVSPSLRHALCTQRTRRAANNPPSVKVREWSPDFTLSQPLNYPRTVKRADVTIQLEDVGVQGADDV